jgi:hypothetical protein
VAAGSLQPFNYELIPVPVKIDLYFGSSFTASRTQFHAQFLKKKIKIRFK